MTTNLLNWSDRFLIGSTPMDDTHREFVRLIKVLQLADQSSAQKALLAIQKHCQEHFADEEALMQKFEYPSVRCHSDEHAAVLASVFEVETWWSSGADIEVIHRLGNALAEWFGSHTDYLDSALSQWIAKRQYDGFPVVVRRMEVGTHENRFSRAD